MTSINSLSVLVLTTFLLLTHTHSSDSEPLGHEKQALISFIFQVPHSPRIGWNASTSVCAWVGVYCDPTHAYVHTLRLPAVGLIGPIPDNTIGRLTQLRVLSIHSNYLSGSLPHDLANLTLLRALYIGNNNFSGSFPLVLTRLTRLTRLDLSYNNFTGSIPVSLNNLTRLNGLFLQRNRFTGSLPNLNNLATLIEFNVSNNHLNGSIPRKLTKFPLSSFMGNLQLCGGPLPPCKTSFLPPSSPSSFARVPSSPAQIKHKNSNNHLSKWGIIGIILASIAVFSIVLILFIIFCLTKTRRSSNNQTTSKSYNSRGIVGGFEPGTSSSKDDITTSGTGTLDRNKLVNVNNVVGMHIYTLEDLLRASAEVLGKGSMGTSYKAVLEDGTTVVVKRLKDVVVGKREFEEQMNVVGKCNKSDENVGVLRGYYYSKDEKLLVFDYFAAGSLSALLHGSRVSGRTTLDWENRLRIASSSARGLAYLHNSHNLVHGNIKSSNILLQPNITTIVISDFGLTPLFASNPTSSTTRLAGYRAPEVMGTQKPTFKSDVYSYGVLLLEILTGKSPVQASLGDEGVDLPRWVQSVVREEWTAEVFDVELIKYDNNEEEMVQLLQIAMACVAVVPDQRPSMNQVLRMIEEMSRSSESVTDDGIRQSSDGQTPPKEEPSQTTPPYSPFIIPLE